MTETGRQHRLGLKLPTPSTHITWIGAMHSALAGLSLQCDIAEVAGMSGYAFILNIHPELCPSGPVAFEWSLLVEGTQALGREIELICLNYEGELPPELTELMFERVRSEIDAGHPGVVWGAAARPGFALIHGYAGDSYLLWAARTAEDGAPDWRETTTSHKDLWADGKVAAFFFGEQLPIDRTRSERAAVVRALKLLRAEYPCFYPEYAHGAAAFRSWADSLLQKKADPAGNVYNLAGYAELQQLGSDFLIRLSRRHRTASKELAAAGAELAASARNLKDLFSRFRTHAKAETLPEQLLKPAAELLLDCQNHNITAQQALSRSLNLF